MAAPQIPTAAWTRIAHADAWEEIGRHRSATGGGTARLAGVRLMATGLAHPQWNNGDVEAPEAVDLQAVRDWYALRGVPWGLRLPAGARWPHGRKLFTKRLMGLVPHAFAVAMPPEGTVIRQAAPADIAAVVAVDSIAFGSTGDLEQAWLEPFVSQPSAKVALAERDGEVVATGYCVRTDGDAGPAGYVAGIGVLPDARRTGIGAALSSWLVAAMLDAGAELVHLHPDTDQAAAIYRRLGFVEVDGFDVYVDMA